MVLKFKQTFNLTYFYLRPKPKNMCVQSYLILFFQPYPKVFYQKMKKKTTLQMAQLLVCLYKNESEFEKICNFPNFTEKIIKCRQTNPNLLACDRKHTFVLPN